MAHPLRVLFYDDAPDFGGHELQTLAAVRHIAAQPGTEVGFIYFRGNARLAKQVAALAQQFPSFKAMPQDYASLRFQFLRTLFSGRAIRRIAAVMTDHAPDIVVLVQGAIAFCSAGLMAAQRAGLPTISYIPMTHPERVFSASRLRAALREPVNRIYYRLPDEYITISPRMEDYLRRKGLHQPVTVVPAAIDLTDCQPVDRHAARSALGLGADDWVVALIGRVQFWQKRQDLAVQALLLARREIPQLKLLVVGDGPDLAALKELVRLHGLQGAVVFAGWTDGLSPVYSAIDALALPSRYEGVPLVMLQAMYFRRPVIASAVDGMLDILPPHWLFPSGDATAFAARLVQAAAASPNDLLDTQRDKIVQQFSMPVFERAFLAALMAARQRLSRASRTPTGAGRGA
jgi:glycosyltransferase involved in cell wall biosynthesis